MAKWGSDGVLTYNNQFFNDIADDMLLNKQKTRQGPILLKSVNLFSTASYGTYFIVCNGLNFNGYTGFSVYCKIEKGTPYPSKSPHSGVIFTHHHTPHPSDNFTLVRPNKSDIESLFDNLNPIKGDIWT